MHQETRSRAGLISAATLLVVLAACQRDVAPAGPSVLVVTLESVRADHLGAYGDPLAQTPAFDQLAAEGALFSRAYAPAPLTLPSLATLFTGLNPPAHGVRDDGDFALGDDALTLAERFREEGYATVAFTSALLTGDGWGLAQGFDTFHGLRWAQSASPVPLDERDAADVVDDAIAALSAESRPVFAWVDLSDARAPYDPLEPWRSEREDSAYDGEISEVDAALGRLVRAWDAAHPDSLVLITADHGESLGDRGERGHGLLLQDATLRVPLVLRARGALEDELPDPELRADPVGLVDVAPTLAAMLDLPATHGDGEDLRDGGSEAIYHESLVGQYLLGLAPLTALTDADGRVVSGAWTAWYPAEGDRVWSATDARFDAAEPASRLAGRLADQPLGVAPEVALNAGLLRRVQGVGAWVGDVSAAPGAIDPRDAADAGELLAQARAAIDEGRFWPAERMLIEVEDRFPESFGGDLLRARLRRAQGRHAEASLILTGLFARTPTATVALQVADLNVAAGDWEQAGLWYQRALDLSWGGFSDAAAAGLIHVALAYGDVDEAEGLMALYGDEAPDSAEMALARAELLLAADRPLDALEEARYAEPGLPRSAMARVVMARAWWALGESDAALDQLERALAQDRFQVPVRAQLAACLLEVGRPREAARLVAPAVLGSGTATVSALYDEARTDLEALREERRRRRRFGG